MCTSLLQKMTNARKVRSNRKTHAKNNTWIHFVRIAPVVTRTTLISTMPCAAHWFYWTCALLQSFTIIYRWTREVPFPQKRNTFMPQLLFQDRRDIKRASVGSLTHYLVDLRRTLDSKTSLWLLNSETISEVATTTKCRPLELVTRVRNAVLNQKQSQ